MLARMTTMGFKVDKIDEGIAIYKRSVIPAAKSQRGYRGAFLLADRQAGKAVSITFWKEEADAVANEENRYYQEQLVKFIEILTSPPIKETYEVSVYD